MDLLGGRFVWGRTHQRRRQFRCRRGRGGSDAQSGVAGAVRGRPAPMAGAHGHGEGGGSRCEAWLQATGVGVRLSGEGAFQDEKPRQGSGWENPRSPRQRGGGGGGTAAVGERRPSARQEPLLISLAG